MNVTREIIKDLLPLYASGEASADTKRLVEEFLRDDAELRRLADALKAEDLAGAPHAPPAPSAGHADLLRTKSLLRRRTWLLALAFFFTGLPLSFVAADGRIKFFMLRDAPQVAAASLALAVVLWIAFAATARRLKVTGL